MSLTLQQYQALAADIPLHPELATWLAQGDDGSIAAWYNQDAAGPVKAWRTNVQPPEIDAATPWPAFDSLDSTAAGGKKLSWLQIMAYSRNFTKSGIRKWVTDVWGNATAGSNAEAILLGCAVENANRAEVLFGGTVRATNNVSALDRLWVGDLIGDDVAHALRG
jgi:hypothetical protein